MSAVSGDHIVKVYSSMGLVMASIVPFHFPHVVDVRVNICIVYIVSIYLMSFESRVSPSSFGFMFMGNVVLFICNASCALYSAGSGVKSAFLLD